ncbi:MAG: hypothetical protein ACRD4R_14805 [Candidatus Acidiferrales bacterium]
MTESIFDGLVSDENSMTLLLRNMMRYPAFLEPFLSTFLSEADASRITDSDVHTQERLRDFGQPDMLIRTGELCALIEVKFTEGRGCTANQPKGYLAYLQKLTSVPKRWLVFLVPKDSICHEEIRRDLEQGRAHYGNIQTKVVDWENILGILNRIDPKVRDPLVEQFRKLLDGRFGPVAFSREESRMLVSDDFAKAYATLRKLENVIDGMCKKAQAVPRYGSVSMSGRADKWEEYGIYFRNAQGRHYLFFGFWLDFFKQEKLPLCVCIQDKWKEGIPQLASVFRRRFKDRTIRCKDWDVSGIPQKLLEGDNPIEEIWAFLQPLLDELMHSSDERPRRVAKKSR